MASVAGTDGGGEGQTDHSSILSIDDGLLDISIVRYGAANLDLPS